ncbi:MAG: ribonuclease H-like domain-containing protein [Oligoflexales bacterium]
MLEYSFLHCKGIAKGTAQRLHKAGFESWAQALDEPAGLPLGAKRKQKLIADLRSSQDALKENDMHFFLARLPKEERWRVLAKYYSEASFLDIETTGFSPYSSDITLISVLHQGKVHLFVKGQNLKKVITLLGDIKLLVTFCGSNFDIPFLLEAFRLESFPFAHVDLRWQSNYLGWTGGLKNIEVSLGLSRPKEYKEMSGLDAVELWEDYWQSKNNKLLNRLKAYSLLDVLSLQLLMLHLLKAKNHEFIFPELEKLKNNFGSYKFIEDLLHKS